jgi:hypothetical protein
MLHRVGATCLTLLAFLAGAGSAAAQASPAGSPPMEPGGRFLLLLILAGAGLLAVRKERR